MCRVLILYSNKYYIFFITCTNTVYTGNFHKHKFLQISSNVLASLYVKYIQEIFTSIKFLQISSNVLASLYVTVLQLPAFVQTATTVTVCIASYLYSHITTFITFCPHAQIKQPFSLCEITNYSTCGHMTSHDDIVRNLVGWIQGWIME